MNDQSRPDLDLIEKLLKITNLMADNALRQLLHDNEGERRANALADTALKAKQERFEATKLLIAGAALFAAGAGAAKIFG